MARITNFLEVPTAGIWLYIEDDSETRRMLWLKDRNAVKDLIVQLREELSVDQEESTNALVSS